MGEGVPKIGSKTPKLEDGVIASLTRILRVGLSPIIVFLKHTVSSRPSVPAIGSLTETEVPHIRPLADAVHNKRLYTYLPTTHRD